MIVICAILMFVGIMVCLMATGAESIELLILGLILIFGPVYLASLFIRREEIITYKKQTDEIIKEATKALLSDDINVKDIREIFLCEQEVSYIEEDDVKTGSELGLLILFPKYLVFHQKETGHGDLIIKANEVQKISGYKNYVKLFDGKSEYIFKKFFKREESDFLKISGYKVADIIKKRVKEGKELIEKEKKGPRIHIKVDFSFLKDLMIKKGVQVGKINCPNCGAPVEIPESGRVFTCQYCNTAVTAVDVFKELQDLFKGILPENVKIENGAGKIFCPNCGNLIPEDSEFCPNCGEKV